MIVSKANLVSLLIFYLKVLAHKMSQKKSWKLGFRMEFHLLKFQKVSRYVECCVLFICAKTRELLNDLFCFVYAKKKRKDALNDMFCFVCAKTGYLLHDVFCFVCAKTGLLLNDDCVLPCLCKNRTAVE